MDFYCAALLLLVVSFAGLQVTLADEAPRHFVNAWAAEIRGGEEVARDVAEQHGYRLVRSLENLQDLYLLEREDTPHRSKRSADHHTRKLSDDDRVVFAEQQKHNLRVKRDLVELDDREIAIRNGILDDPEYPHEWYLNQAGPDESRRDSTRADLRVRQVWQKGLTGKGVVVTVIDDGLETEHADLKDNIEPRACYDFNSNDNDPSPRYDRTNENKHGTRCAGEIGMIPNNGICGVGIAHGAKLGGIRMLDGTVTDLIEGQSLSYAREITDIFSCSWGPNDDGRTLEKPGTVTTMAIEEGVKKGRGGKGSIFVWASGNGGRSGDNCNADGYTSRPETITVSSASQDGKIPFYTERCASTITTAYSSGSSSEAKVISSDLHGKCTDSHSGTSAAAPMAAGIIALLLEANPNLTWRDVHHIVMHTSRMEPLALEKGWYKNGAGYCVNLAFGFGLMDALAMVELGNPKTWKSVGELKTCKVEITNSSSLPMNFLSGQSVEVEFKTDGCKGQENEVNILETIQVVLSLDHESRGSIYAEIESPMGTITPLMLERPMDNSGAGYKNWPLTSTHCWGETSQGTYKFRVADRTYNNMRGSLKGATLILYGTKERPEHQKEERNRCGDLNSFADKLDTIIDINRYSDVDRTMQSLKTLLNSSSQGDQTKESLSKILQDLQKPGEKTPAESTLSKPNTDLASLLKTVLKG